MAKCLRCGAGSEWLEGRVKDELSEVEVGVGKLSFVIHKDVRMPKDEVVVWQGTQRWRFKLVDTGGDSR